MASLVLPPSEFDVRSFGTVVAAAMQGALFELPAGDAVGSFDVQWRDERSFGARTVATAQAGFDIPLWADVLDAHLGTRWDRFSDVGDSVTSSHSLQWRPKRDFELHASYASQFRVPSLFETTGPSREVPTLVSDPRRGGEVESVSVRVGSNSELPLVRGDSRSLGFSVSPLEKLTLKADYWSKRAYSRIMAPPLSQVLEHEAQFPGSFNATLRRPTTWQRGGRASSASSMSR